jgi:NAD(P)-dependent dehydrogenase (short-subunit alcohol dehydrogenase family)
MGLAGKTVLVTGAANGIGMAISERLIGEGARVCAIDADAAALAALGRRLGAGVVTVAGDVRDDGVLERAKEAMTPRFGPCDGLVNNAGIMVRKPLAELSLAEWQAVLDVNLTAALRYTKALAPDLAAQQGAVVNICSTRAHMSEPDTEAYAAAKGGLLALTHALAVSLAPRVRVNAVSPGWIDVSARGPGRRQAELRPLDHEQHPAGRVGRPEDVAELVTLLLRGTRTGFVTGAEFVTDGGMTRKMIYAE